MQLSLSFMQVVLSSFALKFAGQSVQNPSEVRIYVAVQVSLSFMHWSLSASALKLVGQAVQRPVASKI